MRPLLRPSPQSVLLLLFLALPAILPPAAAAAPEQQDPPAATVFLPLGLHGVDRTGLISPLPAPSATPGDPIPPPTIEPTAVLTPAPTATATSLPLPPIEIEGDWVRTPHYALLSPSTQIDKRELGLMMEQFYDQATAYFDAEPEGNERLVGKIFADQASYRAGLRDDGISPGSGGSGGYFDPGTKTFYLFVQPSRHYTRMLTMHEAGHQLQRLAGHCSYPGWWTEGEAEHLGMHAWDGTSLHMSRQPPISLEDHPKSALNAFRNKGEDFGYIVRGEGGWSYREAWAVVSFLADDFPTEFQDLRARYCSGGSSEDAWREVFGEAVSAEMNTRYEAWLESNQQPWSWVWNAFEPWGDRGFHGKAMGSNALAAMKQRPDDLEIEIEPISDDLRAGIVVAYYGTHDFVMLRLYADRRLQVIRVTEGFQWEWLLQTTAPEPEAGALDRMRARVENERLVLSMNGREIYVLEDPRDVAGSFGMNLEGCEIWVRVLP